MKKPVLVIMAAGMGSRYGGLKQIDPVDDYGHIIMDFSIYDAKRAGFEADPRQGGEFFDKLIKSGWEKAHVTVLSIPGSRRPCRRP